MGFHLSSSASSGEEVINGSILKYFSSSPRCFSGLFSATLVKTRYNFNISIISDDLLVYISEIQILLYKPLLYTPAAMPVRYFFHFHFSFSQACAD